jgi:hypothetical protein
MGNTAQTKPPGRLPQTKRDNAAIGGLNWIGLTCVFGSDKGGVSAMATYPSFTKRGTSSLLLGPPSNSLSRLTKFLIAVAMTPLVGYLVFASARQQMNVPTAPQSTIDTSPIASLPFEQVVPSSGGANDGAEPELRTTSLQAAVGLNIKPSDSEIDATSPQTVAGTDKGATSADAVPGVQDAKPPIERGGQFVVASLPASSCFSSASAVRQGQPGAWPSWTLRAPGHEGTKCWYAATRATARDHQRAMLPTAPAVGSPRPQNGEYGSTEP